MGIQWLVTGKTQGGLRHAADRNLMGREEALRSYSAAGAWMSHEEDKKGTLSVGKWADLAVLNGDYLNVPEDRISQLSSVLTWSEARWFMAKASTPRLLRPHSK